MPDVFAKGQGHRPVTTVAGHYLGMHAPERPELFKPEQLWYRGDDYEDLDKRVESLADTVEALTAEVTELTAAVRRRAPKKAEKT